MGHITKTIFRIGDEKVDEIKSLYQNTGCTTKEISTRFNIPTDMANRIITQYLEIKRMITEFEKAMANHEAEIKKIQDKGLPPYFEQNEIRVLCGLEPLTMG